MADPSSTERTLPPGWEPPPPGSVWSAPAEPGAPLPPPPGPPLPPPPSAAPVERTLYASSLRGLSIALVVALAAAAVACVVAAAALSHRADVVARIDSVTTENAEQLLIDVIDADDRAGAAAGGYLVTLLAAGILWLIWQRRFVRNAAPFGPIAPSPGWGTFGWICPFANLYLPQSQLANAARATDPARVATGRSGAAPAVLYFWWVAFSGGILVQIAGNLTRPSGNEFAGNDGVSSFKRADELAALGFGVGALAAVLAIATVVACAQRQKAMLGALGVRM